VSPPSHPGRVKARQDGSVALASPQRNLLLSSRGTGRRDETCAFWCWLCLISLLWSNAHGQEVIAKCSLVVDGSEVWNGKCCVTAETTPYDMTASLHAESWQACLYNKRHPQNARLPTYRQKCLGPWINTWQEPEQNSKANNYLAYWSIEGACHGGENYPATRIGNVYQGEKFIFEWHEIQ
jgi:hypothetical protein